MNFGSLAGHARSSPGTSFASPRQENRDAIKVTDVRIARPWSSSNIVRRNAGGTTGRCSPVDLSQSRVRDVSGRGNWNGTVVAEHRIGSRQSGPVPAPRSLHFTRNGNCSRRPLHVEIATGNLAAESSVPCTGWNDFAGPTPMALMVGKKPHVRPLCVMFELSDSEVGG